MFLVCFVLWKDFYDINKLALLFLCGCWFFRAYYEIFWLKIHKTDMLDICNGYKCVVYESVSCVDGMDCKRRIMWSYYCVSGLACTFFLSSYTLLIGLTSITSNCCWEEWLKVIIEIFLIYICMYDSPVQWCGMYVTLLNVCSLLVWGIQVALTLATTCTYAEYMLHANIWACAQDGCTVHGRVGVHVLILRTCSTQFWGISEWYAWSTHF